MECYSLGSATTAHNHATFKKKWVDPGALDRDLWPVPIHIENKILNNCRVRTRVSNLTHVSNRTILQLHIVDCAVLRRCECFPVVSYHDHGPLNIRTTQTILSCVRKSARLKIYNHPIAFAGEDRRYSLPKFELDVMVHACS